MTRILAIFGLAIVFLTISPKLRDAVIGILAGGVHGMEFYAPYSYVALALVAVGSFLVSVNRGSQPR